MTDLGGGFFGSGAGTPGGGGVGDGLDILAKVSATVTQAASPNDTVIFTAPVDGIYQLNWVCIITTPGVGAGFLIAFTLSTDRFGNPSTQNFGGPVDNAPGNSIGFTAMLDCGAGTTVTLRFTLDDAPAVAKFVCTAVRVG